MSFYDEDYSGDDFRRVEKYYTQFWFNKSYSGPGIVWYTQYFYKKMKNGKYRLVEIGADDNDILRHEEFEDAKRLVFEISQYWGSIENEAYEFNCELLNLFPEDLRPYPQLIATELNAETAALLLAAKHNNDKKLIEALLPAFETIREKVTQKQNKE